MSVQAFISAIDTRLKEIEDEKAELLRLRRRYAPHIAPSDQVLHGTPAVAHAKATSGTVSEDGVTASLLRRATERPGILAPDLVTSVVDEGLSQAKRPRKSVQTVLTQLVRQGRIRIEDGKVFATS